MANCPFPKQIISGLIVLSGAAAGSPRAMAEPIKPEHVQINWASSPQFPKPTAEMKKDKAKMAELKNARKAFFTNWRKACKQLGESLKVGGGPWGFGAFSSYSCHLRKKKILGPKRRPGWLLEVNETKKATVVSLKPAKPKARPVAPMRLDLPRSEYFYKFMADNEYTDLIAYYFLDGLPVAMGSAAIARDADPVTLTGRYPSRGEAASAKFGSLEPPAKLIVYSVDVNPRRGLWLARVYGTAKVKETQPPRQANVAIELGKKKSKNADGRVVWELASPVRSFGEGGYVWAHNAEGPGTQQKKISEMLKSAQAMLDEAGKSNSLEDFLKKGPVSLKKFLLETASGGYVGLRYGKQILSGDQLLSRTAMFGLLVEVGGGPLSGLRYYYDKVPATSLTLEGSEPGTKHDTYVDWSRHVLGGSIGFSPGFLIDRIDIIPKLGIWQFRAKLPAKVDENNRVVSTYEFNMNQSISYAVEVGVEVIRSWFKIRGWYGLDTGISLLGKGGQISSSRFGLDSFFTAGPDFSLFGLKARTALLGFFVFESVKIEGEGLVQSGEEQQAVKGIEYEGGYLGGGIAINW